MVTRGGNGPVVASCPFYLPDLRIRSRCHARSEWAIRQLAMWGEPNHHATNRVLARQKKAESGDPKVRFTPKELSAGVPAVVKARSGIRLTRQA